MILRTPVIMLRMYPLCHFGDMCLRGVCNFVHVANYDFTGSIFPQPTM